MASNCMTATLTGVLSSEIYDETSMYIYHTDIQPTLFADKCRILVINGLAV